MMLSIRTCQCRQLLKICIVLLIVTTKHNCVYFYTLRPVGVVYLLHYVSRVLRFPVRHKNKHGPVSRVISLQNLLCKTQSRSVLSVTLWKLDILVSTVQWGCFKLQFCPVIKGNHAKYVFWCLVVCALGKESFVSREQLFPGAIWNNLP